MVFPPPSQQRQSTEGKRAIDSTANISLELYWCVWVNQELPSTIGQLKSLVILNIDRNRLASLPAEVSAGFIVGGFLLANFPCTFHCCQSFGSQLEVPANAG